MCLKNEASKPAPPAAEVLVGLCAATSYLLTIKLQATTIGHCNHQIPLVTHGHRALSIF